jgi:sugar/nucleoside kinase (ribokinase family)
MSPASTELDVLGIGSAIVDVLAHIDEQFLDDRQLVKGSMALIDAEQAVELYAALGPAIEVSGGSTANTLAGVASFGGRAAFVGKVRDDQLGDVFAHDISAVGVRYTTARATEGPETARCLILVTSDAQRTLNTFLGASAELGADDITEAQVASAAITFSEGYLWDAPAPRDALLRAMDIARSAGRRVAFSLSDGFCVERHRADFVALVRDRLDILFANRDEICSLYELDDFEQAIARVRDDIELAFVTHGAQGSVVLAAGERYDVPAYPVDHLVDTTGAGDLFAAGALFGLTNGHDLESSARLGSLAAAEVISHLGARPEISLAELAKTI